MTTSFIDSGFAVRDDFDAEFGVYEVDLVDEGEDMGVWGVFGERGVDGGVGCKVAVEGAGFDVKDVNQDADVAEDVGFLSGEVGSCKRILSVFGAY